MNLLRKYLIVKYIFYAIFWGNWGFLNSLSIIWKLLWIHMKFMQRCKGRHLKSIGLFDFYLIFDFAPGDICCSSAVEIQLHVCT